MHWMKNPKHKKKREQMHAKAAATRRKNAQVRSKIVKQLDKPSRAEKVVKRQWQGLRHPETGVKVYAIENPIDKLYATVAKAAINSDHEMNKLILALGLASLNKVLVR